MKNITEQSKIHSSDGVLVQSLSHEMWGSLTSPCKEQYGDRDGELFTCLSRTQNHSHIVLADNTSENDMIIFPACIESREFLNDVLNALARRGDITPEVKVTLLDRESKRLQIETMTANERTVKNSPKEFARAILAIHLPLYVSD